MTDIGPTSPESLPRQFEKFGPNRFGVPPLGIPSPGFAPLGAGWPGGMRRPHQVRTSAIVGFFLAALLVLLSPALLLNAIAPPTPTDPSDIISGGSAPEFAIDGFLNLVLAGLLIAGGAFFLSGHARGRLTMTGGAAVTMLDSGYWMVRSFDWVTGVLAVFLAGMAIIVIRLALVPEVADWFSNCRAAEAELLNRFS